jgi:regulatory protein YycH of two-component signal transduction system YycFG
MKLESIKSYTLATLVGISFLLTFSLWSYQSNSPYLEEERLVNEEEIDLGGTTETKKTVVQPSSLIFNKYDNYFGFIDPNQREDLYHDIQTWVLYNFRISDANREPNEDRQVEITFPDALPMDIISSIFTVNNVDEIDMPENVMFKRMFISLKSSHTLTFIFLSTDGKTQVKADVNNTQKHELLDNYMTSLSGLEEYTKIDDAGYPIYIPMSPIKITKYYLDSVEIEPEVMKNIMFLDPSEVLENVSDDNEIWYQDGQRSMRVSKNKLSMEYIFPQDTAYNPMTVMDLLEKSINRINSYKGWTDDFRLESVSTAENNVRFQMYYEGYPVFNTDHLAIIEQSWINDEISEQRRPLYQITDPYPESFTLESGRDLINYLKSHTSFDLAEIQDIQVGYRLFHMENLGNSGTLTLIPSWYIKVNDEWQPITIDNENINRKGVS